MGYGCVANFDMSRTLFVTRMLAGLVLVSLLANRELLPMIARNPLSILGTVILVYLVLTVGSLAGLLLLRSWGFYFLYILVPYSTLMLGVSLLPVSTGFLPAEKHWIALVVLNAGVLFVAAVAHRRYRKERATQSS